MTTVYKYVIRYYRVVRKQKRYATIQSPYFAFGDICSESMRGTLRMIEKNDYKIDSYYVTAVLVDTVDGLNMLTVPETALPF